MRVSGEGAALGAVLHAAWVWMKKSSRSITLAEVVKPSIILEEKKRRKPLAAHAGVYNLEKDLFHSLSQRMRIGNEHDPFILRAELSRKA